MNDHKPTRRRHPNHKLISRRDFISQGLLGMTATLITPTLIGSRPLYGDGAPTTLPFLVFDLAGGAALPGNFLVGKQGGPEDLLSSYSKLGWNPRAAGDEGRIDRSFGLPMSVSKSRILAGINATASAEARAKLRMGSLCHYGQDDVGSNPLSANYLVAMAGSRGTYFNGLGTTDALSGGNSMAAAEDPALKPVQVSSVTDITAALSFGPAFQDLPAEIRSALGSTTLDLARAQASRYGGLSQGNRLGSSTRSALERATTLAAGVDGLDPRTVEVFQQVYAIAEDTAANDTSAISAAVTMNVLRQNSGPGVITVPNCDYHDGTSETGDGVDRQIGEHIGRAVEAAHRLNKPLFFQILTDGGMYADDNTRIWRSDAGDKSMSVIGYFNPAGAAEQRRLQIGYYTDDQGVELQTFIGNSPAKVPYVVLANYLNILGRLGELEQRTPRAMFTPAEVDSMLIFG